MRILLKKNHLVPILLILISTLICFTPLLNNTLVYSRTSIANGHWWSILSGHLTHLESIHLLLNVTGVVLIWVLFYEKIRTLDWLFGGFICALWVGCGIYLFNTEIVEYRGLSGVLHGLLIIGCYRIWPVDTRVSIIALLIIGGKIIHEQMTGPSADTELLIGGPVAIDAHMYGVFGGVFYASVHAIYLRLRQLRNNAG